jgi:hypothetical protein
MTMTKSAILSGPIVAGTFAALAMGVPGHAAWAGSSLSSPTTNPGVSRPSVQKRGGNRSPGAPRDLGKGPSFGDTARRSNAAKPPYPAEYEGDTSRGNYGCHELGKRAIDTDNDNWWLRYRACKGIKPD